jgi:hypothetical protein
MKKFYIFIPFILILIGCGGYETIEQTTELNFNIPYNELWKRSVNWSDFIDMSSKKIVQDSGIIYGKTDLFKWNNFYIIDSNQNKASKRYSKTLPNNVEAIVKLKITQDSGKISKSNFDLIMKYDTNYTKIISNGGFEKTYAAYIYYMYDFMVFAKSKNKTKYFISNPDLEKDYLGNYNCSYYWAHGIANNNFHYFNLLLMTNNKCKLTYTAEDYTNTGQIIKTQKSVDGQWYISNDNIFIDFGVTVYLGFPGKNDIQGYMMIVESSKIGYWSAIKI